MKYQNIVRNTPWLLVASILLSACGGGGGSSSSSDANTGGDGSGSGGNASEQNFTVAGNVAGNSDAIILSLNGSEQSFPGPTFEFNATIAEGTDYTVAVATPPSGQSCSVANGQGNANSNITDVAVTCTDLPSSADNYSVGGTITGASGPVTLSLNGVEETFAGNSFIFSTLLEEDTVYTIAIVAVDDNDSCSLSGNTGTVMGEVNTVAVVCEAAAGSGGPPGASGAHRVAKMERDYDNNGIAEAVEVLTYSADGRSVAIESTYTDDGTPDLYYMGNSPDVVYFGTDFTFTAEGLPETFTIENTMGDGSSDTYRVTYHYESSRVSLITQETVNSTESLLVELVPHYTGDQLTSVTSDFAGSSSEWTFTYDSRGWLASSETRGNGMLLVTNYYTWRDDGQLSRIEQVGDLSGSSYELNLGYDAEGKIITAEHVDNQSPTSEINGTQTATYNAQNLIVKMEYDVLSDGSVESNEVFTWEEGGCNAMYAPAFGTLAIPGMRASDSSVFPAGVFARVAYCAE